MVSSSRSVILDIAETTHRDRPRRVLLGGQPGRTRIRSAEPTLVPPNFITSRSFNVKFLSVG